MGVSAAIRLIGALRGTQAPVEAGARTRWRNIVYVLGAIVAYALLLDSLGFVACTFLMFILFLRAVSSQPWSKSLAVALCASAGAYILFDLVLSAQLPKGPLGF